MSDQILSINELKPLFGVDYIHPCALHGGIDEGWYDSEENIPCCPDCGKMLNTDICIWCGASNLSYGNSGDDLMADASVTSSGDLVCANCAEDIEDAENEESFDDFGYDET